MIYAIPFIAVWWSAVTRLPQSITLLNRKPFTCSKCMGFWLSLIHQVIVGFSESSLWVIPLSSLASFLIERILIKAKILIA